MALSRTITPMLTPAYEHTCCAAAPERTDAIESASILFALVLAVRRANVASAKGLRRSFLVSEPEREIAGLLVGKLCRGSRDGGNHLLYGAPAGQPVKEILGESFSRVRL